MVRALGEQERKPPVFYHAHNIGNDEVVSLVVINQSRVDIVYADPIPFGRYPEVRRPGYDLVSTDCRNCVHSALNQNCCCSPGGFFGQFLLLGYSAYLKDCRYVEGPICRRIYVRNYIDFPGYWAYTQPEFRYHEFAAAKLPSQ